MNITELLEQVQAFQERVTSLLPEPGDVPPLPDAPCDAFAALEAAVAELQAANEKLHDQIEEFGASGGLAEAERTRWHELFDLMPDAYLVIDLHGIIRDANLAALRLLGVSQDELIGKSVTVFVSLEQFAEQEPADDAPAQQAVDLRALKLRLLEAQETERRHIARELHDQIGQELTGLKLTLDMSRASLPQAFAGSLDEPREIVVQLMAQVRTLSLDLRPQMLDDLGLLPALLWHFERYTAQTGVQVLFEHSGVAERRFRPSLETAVYRIAQEALTNVARHAGVAAANVRLLTTYGTLELHIQDTGQGFDPMAALAGSRTAGLAGMRERAGLVGGELTIESAPGAGTYLMARIPFEDALPQG
jgi:signal transduction histidine kinase